MIKNDNDFVVYILLVYMNYEGLIFCLRLKFIEIF